MPFWGGVVLDGLNKYDYLDTGSGCVPINL